MQSLYQPVLEQMRAAGSARGEHLPHALGLASTPDCGTVIAEGEPAPLDSFTDGLRMAVATDHGIIWE